MSSWDRVRLLAQEFHAEVCALAGGPVVAAQDLLAGAEQLTRIRRKGYRKDHPLLRGSLARLERNTIIFDNSVESWLALYHQAHEYAHIRLEHGPRHCNDADIDYEVSEDKLPLGVHRVEGYGPQEKTESEANVFAREFLLPCNVLKNWFVNDGLNAQDISTRVGVSIEMVCHQLARALLTPEIRAVDRDEETNFELDDSQRCAAESPEGPLLITAGPGTGKTRTLAARVIYLLNSGASPSSILILTFSNKAAGELRERVKLVLPDLAQKIRIETFHSFGLDLLRKYGTYIGVPATPKIIDPVDAMFLLEESLPELALDHYEKLSEPTFYLNDILKAISRAKDENANPQRYRELALAMQIEASGADEMIAAEKALEVARVYEFYQERLQDNGSLDFGDLLCRSIELLRNHPNVRDEVQNTYQHVLVDEYQDVNRASGLLLKEIVGDGAGLWAVGDLRQSIHRWRGATTENILKFSSDFPNAKPALTLEMNYRSRPAIVNVFSTLAPQMKVSAGHSFKPWEKNRSSSNGTVKYEIASDLRAEAIGIANEIKANYEAGVPFRRQAVICRSHTSLARFARVLEEQDVPILYLGDFFERPEVRDMLSLLSLACEANGSGLLRVARFDEYNIPLVDLLTLRKQAKEHNVPFPKALGLASEIEEISAQGKEALALLNAHLDGLTYGRSAWHTLTWFLFVRSKYLVTLLNDSTVVGQQRRLALYQLIQFAHSHLGRPVKKRVDPKKDLLQYIRRLETYGEEKQLRQVPGWADGIDAVRILTIHAAKGLEFDVVYLPVLARTYLPFKGGYTFCPPPSGLLDDSLGDWRVEEEECLFFVALSRARDYLCISRAQFYGQRKNNPSDFLSLISSSLPRSVDSEITWHAQSAPERPAPTLDPRSELPIFDLHAVDVYMDCPRKYFYQFELGLSGHRDDSSYVQFHRCVYDVLRWLQEERASGRFPDEAAVITKLDSIWNDKGPLGHHLEERYREKADDMLRVVVHQPATTGSRPGESDYEIKLKYGRIAFTIDYVEVIDDGRSPSILMRRHRTGRPTKSEDKPIYALYLATMQQANRGRNTKLEVLFLSTNETKEIALRPQKIETDLKKYDNAMIGILANQFEPDPGERKCPRCPHFFICPAAEDTAAPQNVN